MISRIYNTAVRMTMGNRFTDAQCGFKAVNADVAKALLPLVADDGWFFDTELLVPAEHNGLRIHEVPVDWVDDPDSRVDVVSTAVGDLKGLRRSSRPRVAGYGPARVGRSGPGAEEAATAGRFVGIGGLSTVAYLVLFVALCGPMGSLAGNAVALVAIVTVNAAVSAGRFAAIRAMIFRRHINGVVRPSSTSEATEGNDVAVRTSALLDASPGALRRRHRLRSLDKTSVRPGGGRDE